MQAVAALHETPPKELSSWKGTLVEGWIVHVVPFHRSARPDESFAWAEDSLDPTASHAVAEMQDTACKLLMAAPVGFGVVWIVHAAPFQRSAKVRKVLPSLHAPTAVQAAAEVHETPLNEDLTAPVGTWVDSSDHVVPFQRSAKVVEAKELFSQKPTALQAVADVHDTPLSSIEEAPLTVGTVWIPQVVPFQRSANATVPVPFELPTAVQAVADVHETPSRLEVLAPVGFCVVWIVHVAPFQRSAKVLVALPLDEDPTAVHAVAEMHDTACSVLEVAPLGLGVRNAFQAVPSQVAASVRVPA